MSFFFVMSVFVATWNSYDLRNENDLLWFFSFFWEWGGGVCGWVCTRRIGLQVIVEKMKTYSYLHVPKNLCTQDIA
jgi:hypothetical protein